MTQPSTEMRFFYLHREVSLSLTEMAFLYARGERPPFDEMIAWMSRRRGLDEEAAERIVLILTHLQHAAYDADNGVQPDDIGAWFAAAEPIAVVFALGAAAARAGNFSADQAQAHAINMERAT